MRFEIAFLGIALGGSFAAGCSSTTPSTPPPAFVDTSSQTQPATPAYPPPPYGPGLGSVVEDFEFLGFRSPQQSTSSLQSIRLSDFYNPHGKDPSYSPDGGVDDRYFPPDSGYPNAGKLKPTVLLIDFAAVWCAPCNQEAKTVMPVKHPLYEACGGEFLLQLGDGPTVSTPASEQDLTDWTTTYTVDYPSSIDPSGKLAPLFQANVLPQNIAIDTTTMKIVSVLGGFAYIAECGEQGYAFCATDADCSTCSNSNCQTGTGSCCIDGATACTTASMCPALSCTPNPFWTTYESFLDKTRSGCTLQ